MGNKKVRKKRNWIIGILIAIILIGAIFSDDEEKDTTQQENLNSNKVENIDEYNEEDNEASKESEQKKEEKVAEQKDDKDKEKDKDKEQTNEEENQTSKESTGTKKEEKAEAKKQQPTSNLTAHFIDAGQADATLFQFSDGSKNYNILFDAGDWNSKDVVSYLQSKSIKKLDIVIISHPHADHIGQLEHIMKQFDVDEVWMSGNTASSKTFQRALEAVLASDANYEEPRAGDVYDVGPLTLEVLHPSRVSGKLNEESIAIRFVYGDVAMLLTGDAYKENEREMMKRASTVKADVLHLGHHGSRTSTDEQFLKAVNPKIAIYSAGKGNSYGHPHAEVVSLVEKQGVKLYGTDVHGTIIVTTDGKTLNVKTNKQGTVQKKTSDTAKSNPKSSPPKKEQSKSNNSKSTNNEKKQEKKEQPKQAAPANCIDINSASLEELQEIIHIGQARAEELIKLRPFSSVDDLTRIKGIGPARIADIKSENKACVGG